MRVRNLLAKQRRHPQILAPSGWLSKLWPHKRSLGVKKRVPYHPRNNTLPNGDLLFGMKKRGMFQWVHFLSGHMFWLSPVSASQSLCGLEEALLGGGVIGEGAQRAPSANPERRLARGCLPTLTWNLTNSGPGHLGKMAQTRTCVFLSSFFSERMGGGELTRCNPIRS